MEIKSVKVGPLETNCYIVSIKDECIIIDPGDEFEKIINNIDKKVVGCLITHSHFDHVGALKKILDYYKITLGKINSDKFIYETINTPGHTSDSVTYYFKDEKVMFTGDFIFYRSIGRTDLGGNDNDMINSLEKIKKFPDDTKIFPGHGTTTILGEEKKYFSYC